MKTESSSHDPYKVLGVGPDATPDEIKRAYRRLAKQYHPDSTGGDKAKERRFKEISAAYDVLGDPEKRARYDAMRNGSVPPGFSGGAEGAFDFGELFEQYFGGRAPPGAGPGQGFHYRVYDVGGDGAKNPFESFAGFGDLFSERPPKRRRSYPANGRPKERTVRASDGSQLTQRGLDIYSDLRIALDQAILGAVVQVPTLSGKASVRIPPGTSSGTRLRLRGKGAGGDRGRHGSHYLTVHIDVPNKIDDDAKRLLVEFMQRVK